MTASPARAQIVGPVADDGVADCIDHQRQDNRDANETSVEADYLAIEKQQKVIETVVVNTKGDRAKSVGGLGADR